MFLWRSEVFLSNRMFSRSRELTSISALSPGGSVPSGGFEGSDKLIEDSHAPLLLTSSHVLTLPPPTMSCSATRQLHLQQERVGGASPFALSSAVKQSFRAGSALCSPGNLVGLNQWLVGEHQQPAEPQEPTEAFCLLWFVEEQQVSITSVRRSGWIRLSQQDSPSLPVLWSSSSGSSWSPDPTTCPSFSYQLDELI